MNHARTSSKPCRPPNASVMTSAHDGPRCRSETQIEDLVRLSRAIYRLSPDESRAYFEQAVQAAERVGDDVSARWSALQIGNADRRPRPALASDLPSFPR